MVNSTRACADPLPLQHAICLTLHRCHSNPSHNHQYPSHPHLQALVYAFECLDSGGPAAVACLTCRGAPAAPAAAPDRAEVAAREAREAQQRAEEAEVAEVLRPFQANNGLDPKQVVAVERVEHLVLWSDYTRWAGQAAGLDRWRGRLDVSECGQDRPPRCSIQSMLPQ